MAKSQASSSQQVSTTTNTVTDSFNQAFSRVESFADVGNVNLALGEGAGGGPSTGLIIVLIGGLLAAIFLLRKK